MTDTQPQYPNREHRNADQAARRRALASLEAIQAAAGLFSQNLVNGYGYIDTTDARLITEAAARLTENVAILETLRDVREWHAADQAQEGSKVAALEAEVRRLEASLSAGMLGKMAGGQAT